MNPKRLDAIQQHMTVRQLVKKSLRASVSQNTFDDFVPWMLDDQRMIEVDRIHEAVKGLANQYKDQPQKRYRVYQEYYTLSNLASTPGIEIENERYRWKYELMRIALIQCWTLYHIDKPECREEAIEHLNLLFHRHWKLKAQIEGFSGAVDTISQQYLDGETLLLQEQQQLIDGLLNDLNSYLEIAHNLHEIVHFFEEDTPPIEPPDNIQEVAEQYKAQWLKRIRQRVAVKVLESLAEDKRAIQLERRWMKEVWLDS